MAKEKQKPSTRDVESDTFIQETGEHQIKHNHLLVIAVDHYEDENIPNLYNCVIDIAGTQYQDGLIQVLTRDYFFDPGNIRFLRSRNRDKPIAEKELLKTAEVERVSNGFAYVGEATNENIIAQLKDIASDLQGKLKKAKEKNEKALPEDNVIICYSGHGVYDKVFNEGYWIPSDGKLKSLSSYIENSTLRTALNAIKSHHTVLISDSCYSGTLFSSANSRSLEVPRVYKKPSRWGLTAGRNEPVSDGETGQNSPFAKELLKILKRKQEVWISDLCNEIIGEIEDNNEKQTPAGEPLSLISGHQNGQFVFLPKEGKESDFWKKAWQENIPKAYYRFLARFPKGEYEKIALEALNVFANGEIPKFSKAALETYDFLLNHITEDARAYSINFIKGITTNVLNEEWRQMYEDLIIKLPSVGKLELKYFTLGGLSIALKKIKDEYLKLRTESPKKAQEFLFKKIGEKYREIGNPYRGLSPYYEENNELFWGRKRIVQELKSKLKETNILIISGAPGSGKTSLVLAGLFPTMRDENDYQLLKIQGDNPVIEFKKIVEAITPEKKYILLLDQYEDFFTNPNESEIEKILTQFDENQQIKIIITLQTTFERQLRRSTFGKLFWDKENLGKFIYRLTSPNKDELREIILGPSWSAGVQYELGLVDKIIRDIQNSLNPLPLLSYILQKLISRSNLEKKEITHKDYHNIGGVDSLILPLQEFWTDLNEEQREVMGKILLRMINSGNGTYSIRRTNIKELTSPNKVENKLIEELLEGMQDNQFVVLGMDYQGMYIDAIRDLVFISWPRIQFLIENFGEENIALQRALWKDANATQPDMYSKVANFSTYWDNNPNLAQILDHLFQGGTDLLCQAKTKLNDRIEEIQNDLSGSDQTTFKKLIDTWKKNKKPEHLDSFIETGASEQILDAFLSYGDHWLNEIEAKFIQESWELRAASTIRLIRERNEAVKAKELAEEKQKEVEELAYNMSIQTLAFKQKYQARSRRDLLLIKLGMKPRMFMILIGIDSYTPPLPPLTSCVNDAKNISKAFMSQQGKLYGEVIIHQLIEKEATRENILKKVIEVRQKITEFDYLVVYFAGHGTINKKDNGIFIPYIEAGEDYGDEEVSLSGKDFCYELMQFKSPVILFTDFCNGGAFLQPLIDANQSSDIEELTNNIFAISSCRGDQLTKETYVNGQPEGVFTNTLLDCFKNHQADADGNGTIYLDEIYRYVSAEIPKRTYEQNPIGIVPATLTNIPLIQLKDTFELPKKEMALTGHIEDDHVIQSIMDNFMDEELAKKLRSSGLGNLIKVELLGK